MKIFLLLLLFPLCSIAQPPSSTDITGAWSGFMNTSQKKLPYEIVISDSSGVLTGFSKVVFNIKGEEYSIVKSLIITNESGKYTLEEDKVLFDNIQDDAPKKVRQITTVSFEGSGKVPLLNGSFKTKVIKGQRVASGDISLHKVLEADSSKLLAELDDLQLSGNLSFHQPKKEAPKSIEIKKDPVEEEPTLALNANKTAATPMAGNRPGSKQPETINSKGKKVTVARIPTIVKTAPVPSKPANEPTGSIAKNNPATKPVVSNPETKQPVPANTPLPVAAKKPAQQSVAFVTDIGKRSIETIQTVYFKTDSLTLSLYDNGEVDGDTVSVIFNGKMILEKQGLSTKAIRKTIYITPEMGDSMQMVMYAENLGSIPPNTGLLILKDGNDRYEIRFSGDMNKNAAIIFKKRKE